MHQNNNLYSKKLFLFFTQNGEYFAGNNIEELVRDNSQGWLQVAQFPCARGKQPTWNKIFSRSF
ncbi:MAG: hypothetical protein M0P70_17590 [Desulfobulbaceae bacterium]|nr:hypothetical protein [Desulfobulbaceae bacterium]